MNKLEEQPKKSDAHESRAAVAVKIQETSIEEQVRQEFEYSADHGQSVREQLKNELGEQKYMLPSPLNSREDAAFTNINPDQLGEAFGIENQRNEPLDFVEKIHKRDENRWALNQASAEVYTNDPIDN